MYIWPTKIRIIFQLPIIKSLFPANLLYSVEQRHYTPHKKTKNYTYNVAYIAKCFYLCTAY